MIESRPMLNIHNGDSTAGTVRKAGVPGEHLAWREALVYGPTPGGMSDKDFRQVRAGHLSKVYGLKFEECEKALREQQAAIENSGKHDEIVLWFEHDLFCQIHLIYLLASFARSELGNMRLSLICIDGFPGISDFRGLGQLNEEQLASLFPRRRLLSSAQMELGLKAWRAFSASDPSQIESLLAADTAALPFLKPALFKHLERFPSVRNGLGRVQDLILELIAAGDGEFKKLFPAFGKREPLYGFGDAQVFLELKRLTKGLHRLLEMIHKRNVSPAGSNASFQITDHGQAVLHGEADFIGLNGIDMWLGGVHLQGNEAAWRWDEQRHALISPITVRE